MTRNYGHARRTACAPSKWPVAELNARVEWRGLLELSQSCVADVLAGIDDERSMRRRADMANRVNGAASTVFARRCGAASAAVADSFICTGKAFARRDTPAVVRAEMAGMVRDAAEFLERRLTQMQDEDFSRHHAGRSEVMG